MPPIPKEPKFVQNVTALQKILAGMAVTCFFVVWFTHFDLIKDVFLPGGLVIYSQMRQWIMVAGCVMTCPIGYYQLKNMIGWAVENYKTYQEFKELKKGKE